MVELDVVGLDAEPRREPALESDRHVAQPDCAMPFLEQSARDDADRVGEVDDPGVRVASPHPIGDVENDRHRAQRLREATGSGGLLTNTAALQRPGLVALSCLLAADPQLEEHGIGVSHAGIEVGGQGQSGRVSLAGQDPAGQPADDLEAFGGRVDQHELLDREQVSQPREPVDQLRGVGGRAAHDRQPHPFTPVRVTPSMNAFCAKKNTMITGAITSKVAAIVRFQLVWCALLNVSSP